MSTNTPISSSMPRYLNQLAVNKWDDKSVQALMGVLEDRSVALNKIPEEVYHRTGIYRTAGAIRLILTGMKAIGVNLHPDIYKTMSTLEKNNSENRKILSKAESDKLKNLPEKISFTFACKLLNCSPQIRNGGRLAGLQRWFDTETGLAVCDTAAVLKRYNDILNTSKDGRIESVNFWMTPEVRASKAKKHKQIAKATRKVVTAPVASKTANDLANNVIALIDAGSLSLVQGTEMLKILVEARKVHHI